MQKERYILMDLMMWTQSQNGVEGCYEGERELGLHCLLLNVGKLRVPSNEIADFSVLG